MSEVRAAHGTGDDLPPEVLDHIDALVESWADRPLSPEKAAEIRPILASPPLADTA